ncbi:hypothetical protein ACWF9G_22970 [Nocardia sp. NPDC055029]
MHSAAGTRVARLLNRSDELKIDFTGERLLTGMIEAELAPVLEAMDRPDYDPAQLRLVDLTATDQGLEFRTHWVCAPDGQPVGLIVWLAPGPVTPRPTYNSWILDVDAVTTQSGGDDLAIIGDGRKPGQPRPIRDLLRYVNADDAPNFLGLYWDSRTGEKGLLAEAMWSIHPPGAPDWVHFWSSAVAGGGPATGTVYGLSVRMPHRELNATMGNMVDPLSTLVLVDAHERFTLHTAGALRDDLSDHHITDVLDQVQRTPVQGPAMQLAVTINERDYHARVWALPSSQKGRPMKPTAILLRPAVYGRH